MASITYKNFSNLQPIELKYQYYKEEDLKKTKISFTDGCTFYGYNTLTNYQDTTINRESVFVLTSSILLNQVFIEPNSYNLGQLAGSVYLQPRISTIYYAFKNNFTKKIILNTTKSLIHILPVPNTNEIELLCEGEYLQVDANYPFEVTTNPESLELSEINRQRFECVYQNSTITFKTKTKDGYRYLAFNNDNILRATGVILNTSVVNDYVLKCIPVSQNSLKLSFDPKNSWLTYYNTFLQQQDNKTLTVNKEFFVPTNYLVDFPVQEAVRTGKATINIANLKTNITPFGSPAPVNNLPGF